MKYNPFDTNRDYPLCDKCYGDSTAYKRKCENDQCFQNFFWKELKSKKNEMNLNKLKNSKCVWITIQDFKRRVEDLDKLKTFIQRTKYLYEERLWCIESGKSDPPNVHIHMLCKIINSKKHKGKLNLEWMKLFDTNLNHEDYYLCKQWRESPEMPPYEQWIEEKKNYFYDELKGNHSNVLDLGARGGHGGLSLPL